MIWTLGSVWVLGEDPEALAEMTALGVTREELEDAVSVGEYARDNCTPFHPRSSAGTVAWSDTRATLARSLSLHGWKFEDDDGLALIVHPSGTHAISVQIGDEETGLKRHGYGPKLKHPKGSAMRDVVDGNDTQQSLFGNDVSPPKTIRVPIGDCKIWFLLRHRAERVDGGGDVRIELSLPRSVSDSGMVTDWLTRIIVGPVETTPAPQAPSVPSIPDAPIDVLVTRKLG